MTFIYLSSMVKKEGDKRCAVAAHVIPTEIDGFLRIDGYASGDSSINKLKTLNKTLHMLPRKDDRIRVVTDEPVARIHLCCCGQRHELPSI